MKFIDEAIIEVKAGNGGNGCISFRREKYVPRGGPNGGDGGNGGSVILKVRGGLTTLMDLKYRKRILAGNGEHGRGKDQYGAHGKDVIVAVPQGTLVKNFETGKLLADLSQIADRVTVAKGGCGGRGNIHFKTSTDRAPRKAEKGEKGEGRKLRLELKLLADVGLVGFPNSGKSTLIAAISNARPKIADYPFTTKIPHLGVVSLGYHRSFVMADIPGLIEGAHKGAGMGIQFLKHIERTRLLLLLIDPSDPERSDPRASYESLIEELALFSPDLLKKQQMIVLTKMDLPTAREVATSVMGNWHLTGKPAMAISAVTGFGIKDLLAKIGVGLFMD